MAVLDDYLDELLCRGRAYFCREEALDALGLNPALLSDFATGG